MQRQLDLCGPFSTGVDRSSRGGRSEGAQETGPRQRPQRIRRILDTLKLGLLDGSVDQSTLARLKVASEGLTERSGDAGLDTVPRRNRPACCGRAGEGWGPLDPGHKFRKSESPEVIEQSPESGLP
ncbi:MAG: flagellar assembly protein FliX [Pseudolabrys sp.]